MFRFAISFTLVLAIAPQLLADEWGSIQGQFILDGQVPPIQLLVKAPIPPPVPPPPCGAVAIPDEGMVIDPETKGIANIFVYLLKAPGKLHPDLKSGSVPEVDFNQIGCRFIPHLLILRTDQTVLCKSGDPIAHNVHTNPFSNTADNLLIPVLDRVGTPIRMPIPERNPIKVQCDIHPWMGAYWLVLDHPYAAMTDETGRFKIENLPAGDHEFRVWNERVGTIDKKWKISVHAGEMQQLPPRKIAVESFKK